MRLHGDETALDARIVQQRHQIHGQRAGRREGDNRCADMQDPAGVGITAFAETGFQPVAHQLQDIGIGHGT